MDVFGMIVGRVGMRASMSVVSQKAGIGAGFGPITADRRIFGG